MRAAAFALALTLAAAVETAAQIPEDDRPHASGFSSSFLELAPLARSAMSVSVATGAALGRFELEPSTAARAAALAASRHLFVEARFRLAPYDTSSRIDKRRFWNRGGGWDLEEKAQDRVPISVAAARGHRPGLVMAPLFEYELNRLEGLVAVDADGREHALKPLAVPRSGDGVWFTAPSLEKSTAPVFSGAPAPAVGFSARMSVNYGEEDFKIRANVWRRAARSEDPYSVSFQKKAAAKRARAELGKDFGVVFDSSGAWHGWQAGHTDEVLSPAALLEESIPWEKFVRARQEAEKRTRDSLAVVRLRFRPDPTAVPFEDDERQLEKRSDAGIPVGPRLLFCARALSPSLIKRLESVEAIVGGRLIAGRFVGTLTNGVAGYLVEAETGLKPLDPGPEPEDGELSLSVEPFAVDEVLQVWAYPDRLHGKASGYDGAQRRKTRYLSAAGGLAAGLDGRPFALMVEEIRSEAVVTRERWNRPRALTRLRPLAELIQAFAKPEAVVDARLRPESGRRPWLGAESQDLSPDLAKLLGVSEATRGGTIGQLVNLVVPGSPAERAGLKPGDVLLRLRETGKRQDEVIPARPRRVVGSASRDVSEARQFLEAPRTGLEEAFEDSAAGTAVTLYWARGEQELSAVVVLEESPHDVASAPKLLDAKTGLTVKELTADVRRILRLDRGFRGLLIYDVERGSPALVAGLRPLGLIVEVDGREMATPAALSAWLEERRRAGAASVKVRGLLLGRPLIADLRISDDR